MNMNALTKFNQSLLIAGFLTLSSAPVLAASLTTVPNTFAAGETIIADEMNENFTAIVDGITNIELTPGPQGETGATGLQGPSGADGAVGTDGVDGINCWDTNQNGLGDLSEDLNSDGQINTLDCQIISSGAGGFFIHWGSTQAAANSTLVYSGYGFSSHYTHSGSIPPTLIEGNMTSTGTAAITGLMFPLSVWDSFPPGISKSYLKGAMCTTDKPSTVIWGTQAAPTGTVELYKGYALGPYYSQQGSNGIICVDSVNFEVDPNPPLSSEGIMYGITLGSTPDGSSGYLANEFISCVVVKTQ